MVFPAAAFLLKQLYSPVSLMIYDLSATYPDLKGRIFGAMQRFLLPKWEPKGQKWGRLSAARKMGVPLMRRERRPRHTENIFDFDGQKYFNIYRIWNKIGLSKSNFVLDRRGRRSLHFKTNYQ